MPDAKSTHIAPQATHLTTAQVPARVVREEVQREAKLRARVEARLRVLGDAPNWTARAEHALVLRDSIILEGKVVATSDKIGLGGVLKCDKARLHVRNGVLERTGGE